MTPADHADDPAVIATTAEAIATTMMELIHRREALASNFDAAISLPPGSQDNARIEGLARDLHDCDRQIFELLDRAATIFASPFLQANFAES
ncbi:hypothetical protein HZF05_13710 [Sphingomonas sp. CGMCC 1.13654]|uniref:Chorismate mutase n=1 Tax=Sphingomonas chungangi TaxID=2683589 RepID=A0A838L743_9SPHN|nr:hypothetical protein [Sphingomonas chungangi]MBA2935141.1 hypothetical protein [Sphingomonas chungangi]MVW57705.1 hypothetical protein [Sphingomonas chungangi]